MATRLSLRFSPTEWATVFISACALFTSVYATYVSTQHIRLSARPILQFHRGVGLTEGKVGVRIENVGNGVALIQRFIVTLDGEMVRDVSDIVRATEKTWAKSGPSWLRPTEGEVIGTDDTHDLFFTDAENIADKEAFQDLVFKRLGIYVEYCSIFGECTEACTANLSCSRVYGAESKVR